jgi:hypothetical protein
MKLLGFLVIAALLAGCAGQATLPRSSTAQVLTSDLTETPHAKQLLYWSLYEDAPNPQIQFATMPLKKSSKAKTIPGNSDNGLAKASDMHIDRLGWMWVLTAGTASSAYGALDVFALPLTPKSAPKYRFILSEAQNPKYFAIDSKGNVWVNSISNMVLEYVGPFKKSGTLRPKLKLTKMGSPNGMAFDKHGNLFVANGASSGKSSIAIYPKPIKNIKPKYLDGVFQPSGLIFDKKGNLYVGQDFTDDLLVARFNSNNLKPGSKPSVTDSHGTPGAFSPVDFAFSNDGDLYVTNCSSYAGIIVFPTSHKAFTNTLAPSVIYTNSVTVGVSYCVWGIAIH